MASTQQADLPPSLGALINSTNGTSSGPAPNNMLSDLDDSVAKAKAASDKAYDATTKQSEILDKDADLNMKDQQQLRDWYKKNPYPVPDVKPFTEQRPQADPMHAFGSWASAIDILAGALTRTPLTSSLRAAAAAMSALRQNDLDAFESRRQAWKDNNEAAIQKADWEVKGYQNALDMMKTDTALGHAALAAHAAAAGNVAMAEMNRIGDIEKIGQYVEGLQRSQAAGIDAQEKFDNFADQKHQEVVTVRKFFEDRPQYGLNPNDPQLDAKAKALAGQNTDVALGLRNALAAQQGKETSLKSGRDKVSDFIQQRRSEYEATHGAGSYTTDMELKDTQTFTAATNKSSAKPLSLSQLQAQEIQKRMTEKGLSFEDAQKLVTAKSSGLTPDTAKMIAGEIIAGDQNAGSGYGRSPADKTMIANAQLDLMKKLGLTPADVAARAATYQGMKAGERALETRMVNLSLAATELKGFIPQAEQASAKFPRTSFPTANMAIKAYETQTGDPNVRDFGATLQAVENTYAQLLTRGAVTTDAARAAAHDLVTTVDSPEAFHRLMQRIQKEADVVIAAPDTVRREILSSVPGTSQGSGPVPGTIEGGYIFKGGDASKQDNWAPVGTDQ